MLIIIIIITVIINLLWELQGLCQEKKKKDKEK